MGNDIGAQQNYQRSVLEAIDTVVQRRIDGLKLDKTVVGIIDKNIGSLAGYPLYQVKYEGGVFTATARDSSESYARNTAVYVMIPQSDFSKEKFIIGRASSISATSAESASISAAINNYAKLGPNLVVNNSIYGLRSYHDLKEENDNPDSYLHRFRFLYSINQEEENNNIKVLQNLFKTYAADATNILLRADFRTNLNAAQQQSASGRYGLAVTLSFTNPNAGYGETQGEILDNLGNTIIGKAQKITSTDNSAYIIDTTTNEGVSAQGWVGESDIDNISLKEWDKRLQFFFNSKDADDNKVTIWQKDGVGLFDCYIQYIQTVYQTFCINNPSLQSSMTDNLVTAYLNLLADLKQATPSLANIKQIYNEWRSTSIGDLSDIDEIIYLTSDSMLGNPFAYTQWNNQYIIPSQQFDFSRFKEIKNIIFFKDGFNQDEEQEQLWPPSDAPKNGGKGWDIFCQNIQLFLLKDLDSEYQGYSLKVECAEGYNGVLTTLSSNEKTAFNAHVYRNQIEELTSNANIQYVWLKQSSQVINASHADYYHYAGVGWKRLKNTNRFFFQTTGNENWAYKNLYKCIALYQTPTETIPLSTNFIVYNDAVSTKVKLESDLGTEFTFSEGAPTITCLIQEAPLPGKTGEEAENYQEYGYESNALYKYQWSITDSNNSSILFLTEAFADNTSNIFKDNIISNIKMWYWDRIKQELVETTDPTQATRIRYPVSLSSSGFVVECIVQKNFVSDISTNTGNYYDVGNDSIEISNLKMSSSSNYRIVIENGDQVFQYDEYGNAPTVSKLKDPLTIKPLHAKILGPTGLEFSSENVNIEWIFNLENTMIVPPDKLVLNPATQQEQLIKGSNCTFDIKKIYDPSAQNNQITCHANFNNLDIYTETKFYFGKIGNNGTNGTDVVSKISYDGLDNYFTLHSEPLTLYVQKDIPIEENQTKNQAMFNVPDSEGDINILKDTQVITNDKVLNVHLYQKDEEIESINFAIGYPRWNIAGNTSGTSNQLGKYFELVRNDDNQIIIIWNPNYNNDKPLFQNIRSEIKVKQSNQEYYSFFSLPIIEYEIGNTLVNQLLPMQRIAIDKETYLVDVTYNADGRNPIYNHNQGLKLINLPDNYTISWKACGGLENNTPCFKIIDSEQNIINSNEDTTIDQVYILPDDVFSGSITNNHIEAIVKQNGNIIATVYAPINMTLNTFGLASLNAWDGNKVAIDENEGYVMAPQIGAGEKDDNNRFTGILMGKTETYTGGAKNEKEIGLFGYAHGLQSIFLDAESGNATFGLPDNYILDEQGNVVSNADDYNEGRIELRPGGVSKIGGWRLGHRGIYYTQSGTIEKRTIPDYIPDINTGQFKQDRINDPYSKHHEKDINYKDSGILLHSGTDPYISIKGRQLTTNDIPDVDVDYIRPEDSLELQLDPMAPTLFTIFRHNGSDWTQLEQDSSSGAIVPITKYEKGSRTFLAGINGKGEFVANTVNSIIVDNSNDVYTTQFSVNSFRAFNDPNKYIDNQGQEQTRDRPGHTGLRIKLGSNILGQMFINNDGFNADINDENHNSTLYITGGLTERNGEYARPLSLHGKHISLFAQGSLNAQNFLPITDSELSLQTNKFEVNLGDNGTTFKLFREEDNNNNLMTMGNFKINAGAQTDGESEEYIYYQDDNNIEKINIRSNPVTYLIFKDSNNNNIYLINNSWTPGFYYYNVGTTDSEYYVSQENYSICYKLLDNYYCTFEDFNTDYYKVVNIPSSIEESDYLYLDKEYMDQHRYIKSNNEYIKVDDDVPYDLNQYIQIPKKEESIDIEQSYFYIPKTDIDLEKLYGFYDINGSNKYVYLVDENLYNKINNKYVLSENFYLEIKLRYNNNNYNLDEIDLDSIYYYCTEIESYISNNILDITYVKNDPIIEEIPVLDDENNITYDNEGNVITTTQTIDMGYRLYDIDIDYNVTQENIYFLYNNNYIPISSIQANTENFIEYVLINNNYVEKNNIETVYLINNELVSESDYNNAINNLYYKVADKDNNIYYITQNNFSIDKFIYYYSNTLINNSNYINRIQLNSSESYSYDETTKIYSQDDNGILYQTFIMNPNTENSEYIPIKQTSNNAYINKNNIYINNRLYPENPWYLRSELTWNEEETNKYTYYFNETNDLIIRPFEELNTYYAVRDVNNNLYYILSNYLDNYVGDKYIFINNNYRKIINNPVDEDENDSIVLISKKQYELYAGSYFSRITTNTQSNKYISLEGNNKGINLFNSSGPISIFSKDTFFKLKLNSGEEISFGSISTKFKNEYIIGKFIKNNVEDGLSFTNNWLRLKSPSIQIDNNNHFELISKIRGSGNVYTATNPQIVLRAGSEKSITPGITKPTGAAVELILNSSNNNWMSAIKGKDLEKRGAWPIFAIRTSYSGIGIYPEVSKENLYREIFYVAMSQCNSMGLSVQGTIPNSTDTGLSVTKNALINGMVTTKTGFKGNGIKVTNTCGNSSGTFSPSGGGNKTLGTAISITTLKATIKNGRPTFGTEAIKFSYAMPTATDIPYGKKSNVGSTLDDLIKRVSALEKAKASFATKTELKNALKGKADANHSHSFKYDTFNFRDKNDNTHTAVLRMSNNVGKISVTVK